MLAGVLLAAVASVLFNAAIVLQAAEARTVPGCHGLRISLFARLLRRPRWVAGIALSVIAVGVQILALTQAPLTVVQPADAAGLVLLLVIGSRVLDERVGAREGGAVIGIVVAIVAIVIAQPAGSETHTGAVGISCALALIGAVAAAPFVLRSRDGCVRTAIRLTVLARRCRSRRRGRPPARGRGSPVSSGREPRGSLPWSRSRSALARARRSTALARSA